MKKQKERLSVEGVGVSAVQEIVTLMENMEPDDLKEMMSTLFTIPGYFTELLSSLPVLPSMEVQNLAFKVTSLSEEVRELIKEFINLTANSGHPASQFCSH
ncbi:hypothetical protein C0Q70_12597 [Pomacea canaliculata]|uniref:Uncharacterized protein n=1 Tax=Pomacea canaliculata TaxID=400727 RepID=A0A2T7P1Z9_POMCA|nr:hypothetical protein C0Q70_12597 [Pomacea canaliculata]